ncbi:MAG TPA: low affinity iron permease family protein [Chthoniobacterales bacterium]|nr:low affinity iron permease family protein [Chthoniobacterales bacterium]
MGFRARDFGHRDLGGYRALLQLLGYVAAADQHPGTTIGTFLMVFIIQNTQNRDSKAVHLKLDELIRAIGSARNHLVNLDRLSDEDLKP